MLVNIIGLWYLCIYLKIFKKNRGAMKHGERHAMRVLKAYCSWSTTNGREDGTIRKGDNSKKSDCGERGK